MTTPSGNATTPEHSKPSYSNKKHSRVPTKEFLKMWHNFIEFHTTQSYNKNNISFQFLHCLIRSLFMWNFIEILWILRLWCEIMENMSKTFEAKLIRKTWGTSSVLFNATFSEMLEMYRNVASKKWTISIRITKSNEKFNWPAVDQTNRLERS